jgi:hypothetical protein
MRRCVTILTREGRNPGPSYESLMICQTNCSSQPLSAYESLVPRSRCPYPPIACEVPMPCIFGANVEIAFGCRGHPADLSSAHTAGPSDFTAASMPPRLGLAREAPWNWMSLVHLCPESLQSLGMICVGPITARPHHTIFYLRR